MATEHRLIVLGEQEGPLTDHEDPLWVQWQYAKHLATAIHNEAYYQFTDEDVEKIFGSELDTIQECVKWQIMVKMESVDDNILPISERRINYMFGQLEVLRVFWKLCDSTRDYYKKKEKKPQALLKIKKVDKFAEEIQVFYGIILDAAKARIDALKDRGEKSILAQVRWGATGEELKCLMSDEDQRFYAREYADSNIDTLQGILKVRLR